MNIQEAAIKWWDSLDFFKKDKTSFSRRIQTMSLENAIHETWMQEIVLPWWSNNQNKDKLLMDLVGHSPRYVKHEEIASIYLKEHEVKEEVPNQEIGLAEQPEVSLHVKKKLLNDLLDEEGRDDTCEHDYSLSLPVCETVKKYVWLNMNTGEFSNSWSEKEYPRDTNASVWDVVENGCPESIKEGFRLIEYEIKRGADFEFNHWMKIVTNTTS